MPLGHTSPSAATDTAPSAATRSSTVSSQLLTRVEVEADVADVRGAVGDDHVVGRSTVEPPEIGEHASGSSVIDPDHGVRVHHDSDEGAVFEPSQPGR